MYKPLMKCSGSALLANNRQDRYSKHSLTQMADTIFKVSESFETGFSLPTDSSKLFDLFYSLDGEDVEANRTMEEFLGPKCRV